MSQKRLYLIDATAFCYRAFYAFSGLATSFGQPTNAIFGFVNMLQKILKEKKPDYLAVCFDVSRQTFRQKKFAEYKIQRPPMPDELSSQIPYIKQIVAAFGIPLLEKEGFEADDIIATVSAMAKKKCFSTTIISSDKDMLQLVDKQVEVFSPYKNEGLLYDIKAVSERFGVKPQQIPDIIALMGDTVDNIPGVKGIGEKTAVELIKEFGSVEGLLECSKKIKSEKLRNLIEDNRKIIALSKELALLEERKEIGLDWQEIKLAPPDYQELFRLFKHLEFRSFLKGLPQACEKPIDAKIERVSSKQAGDYTELFLWGDRLTDLVFSAQGKFFQLDEAREILEDAKVKKISHDLKKIKLSLAKDGIELKGAYFDTMIASYLINSSAAGYNLEDLAWDYLGQEVSGAISDPAKALDLLVRLKPKLEIELKERKLTDLFFDTEMPLLEVLARMELAGVKLDLKVLEHLSVDLEKKLVKLIDEIYALSGTEFNINSPKQLGNILFEQLKLPVIKRGKTGPSTDEEVLRTLAAKHKLPQKLLEYRQLMKLKNTYVDTLPTLVDQEERLHTSFNQTVTETGRLSSTSPNLQNIPVKTDIGRQIRRSIISGAKNELLVASDYSQIELRILAHLSGDEFLIEAFKKEKDVHKMTAALIYNTKEEDVSDEMRETAKRVNFGIIYGLTAYGLSRDLGINLDEAQSFIDAYFLRYPKVKDYIEEQIKFARKEGFVSTILGRRRYLAEINNRNQAIRQFAERQAANTPIQGSASDLIKLAMIRLDQDLKAQGKLTRMVLQIHDELLFEVPQAELKEAVALIKERMENVLALKVPVRVSIKQGKNWLEMEPV